MRVTRYDNVISREIRNLISSRYRRITKVINREFWNSESETDNSLYVGSYGRNTAISTSDIDILINLPNSEFDRFNSLKGNSQSRLLQAVRRAIKKSYPNSDIRADGQIVKVNFSDGVIFEILPVFKRHDRSFVYPDSNMGGNWMSTNPKAEQEAIKERNRLSNGLLVSTCRHMRYIRDNYFKSYHLSGIVIDSFVYDAIGNWKFVTSGTSTSPAGTYEQMLFDYYKEHSFYWNFNSLTAPGSGDEVSVERSQSCLGKVLNYMID
ncbi:SMODS domain-containing nucleotidyltransferase [Clostridium cochlearium]|uniref:Nucleotidyltransferase n=1 Tax=Clostridium cochlearium TaxID=1494 RepID=A0A7Y3XXT0_CLOCO|nr:nucleotidyltransferase domain-containing protein [Clostridium cochlearium]NOH15278.1 nucleotidyltransferase [Clostridium cochlearium]